LVKVVSPDAPAKAPVALSDDIVSLVKAAELILVMVSADYLSSDYLVNRILPIILEQQIAGRAVVIPIIVRPTAWAETPLGKLQALPRDARAISTFKRPR
jgi:hypothetical protein